MNRIAQALVCLTDDAQKRAPVPGVPPNMHKDM
jgi:hypothetical protein